MTSASDWADFCSPDYFKRRNIMIDISIVYDELSKEFEDLTLPDLAKSIKLLNISLENKGLPLIDFTTKPLNLSCEDKRLDLILYWCKSYFYRHSDKVNESLLYEDRYIRETLKEKREIAIQKLEEVE